MSKQLIQGIVRILDVNGDIAGTGFVVSESGLIATCSHVIQHEELQKRGEPRPEKVTIVFHATGEMQDAQVKPDWWLSWDAGDLAIIQVKGLLPQGVRPLPLGSAEGTNGHEIHTFGFPTIGDIEAMGADGQVVRILYESGRPLIQLRSSEITVGFSGAPIWDQRRQCVIGMASAIAEPDPHDRLSKTAFAISTETLRNVCPALQISEVCPYRGLAAFRETDAEFFFGRQQTVESLLNRLYSDPRFLMVLGPSGSGKSSVIQAGLIPQLKSGKLPGSDHWEIIITRPVNNPFDELAKQGLVDESHDLTEHFQVWLDQLTEQERLMLVIDQFEELFSLCPAVIRQDFITQLVKLLHSSLPITVVMVMRDDFYSRFTQQEALVEWLERSRGAAHVPKLLKRDELIAIVQKPVETIGLRHEEGLVEMIVKDTLETSVESEDYRQAGRSAVLPLLEFALTELWRQRQEGMLTHEAYRNIRGVAGALTQWADRALSTLKDGEKLAQRILTDLVYLGDKSQGILDSRRRRTLISLCRNESEQESVQQVVQHLVENRLLVTDRDPHSNKETVEIIHDVLLREWGQLKGWLETDHRFLTWHLEIERLMHGWIITRDKTKLLRGRDLAEAKVWLKERRADLNQSEIAFLQASATQRIQVLISLIVIVLLLISSTGLAGWFFLTRPPSPTLVTTLQDSVNGSLRYCIDNAPSKSTIRFAQGLRGTIKLIGGLAFAGGKQFTIVGPGANQLTISGGNLDSIIHMSKGAILNISGLSFKNSETINDAFLFNEGTLILTNSIISGNKTTAGGAIFINSVSSGGNSLGGGIENRGTLTVINSTISNNSSSGDPGDGLGGGIENEGQLTVIHSTFSNNSASSADGGYSVGGGIDNYDKLTVVSSTFSSNSVISSSSSGESLGGGIFNHSHGTLTVTGSTFSNNSALSSGSDSLSQGGGIDDDGKLTVVNSTFMNNSATSSNNSGESLGGGIFSYGSEDSSVAIIRFCTIYGNTSSGGGGIWIDTTASGLLTISGSIIAANSAHDGPDISGELISDGYNLIENVAGATGLNAMTDKLVSLADLKVDSTLRNNSGPTQTLAPFQGSPAIDAIPQQACNITVTDIFGHDMTIATDQRGNPRPDGSENACDIGAYESSY